MKPESEILKINRFVDFEQGRLFKERSVKG